MRGKKDITETVSRHLHKDKYFMHLKKEKDLAAVKFNASPVPHSRLHKDSA